MSIRSLVLRPALATALLAAAPACTVIGEEGPPPEEDDLVADSGKFDTGYYSSLATELEGEFRSTLELDVSQLTAEEREAERAKLETDRWALSRLVDQQLKLAKNQLGAEKLHLNLSSNDVVVEQLVLEGDILRVDYVVTADTLVSFKELKESGINPSSLEGKEFAVKVALDPRELFTRYGEACATGFDAGALADYNYFYYFDPSRPGCEMPLAEGASFKATSLLPHGETYPEYDRLAKDGQIDVKVFFGAAGHDETIADNDWGMINWRAFEDALDDRGFVQRDGATYGQRWTRTRGGLIENVDVLSPYDLFVGHNSDAETAERLDRMFVDALQTGEVLIYNGHSFYGSLDVFEEAAHYPSDRYQILFMNSCWSYEYYTKQVFRNKATPSDPEGWDNADVINDSESGWFHNMEPTTRIVLTNLLAGAESGGQSGAKHFTWQAIIGAMNDHVVETQATRDTSTHEIYGVSGVRTNRYRPN